MVLHRFGGAVMDWMQEKGQGQRGADTIQSHSGPGWAANLSLPPKKEPYPERR